MEELTLYHFGSSVCAAKVRLALVEKNLRWTSKIVGLRIGGQKAADCDLDQHDPEYLRLNPNGVVPTLVHNGRAILQSTAINEYLDDAFQEHPLRPSDPGERALMRTWTMRLDSGLHEAVAILTFAIAYRYRMLQLSPAALAKHLSQIPDHKNRAWQADTIRNGLESLLVVDALRAYDSLMKEMNVALESKKWLAGEQYSLAEVSLASYFFRLEMLQLLAIWTEKLPAVAEWYERIKSRPSFEVAIVKPAPEENLKLMRKNGAEMSSQVREQWLAFQ